MPASASASASANPGNQRRLWLFRFLLLLGAPLLFLGGLEIALRVAGTGYDSAFLVSDESDSSKVRDNYRFAWRFFPRALARVPQPVRVQEKKPEGVRRIVVFGGSAAMGDPQPAFGMPRVLQRLLEGRYPGASFEVINAAFTAINSHVVLPLARDCVLLDADLWVVYMGNNEVNGPYGSGSVFGSRRPSRAVIRASLAFQRTRLGQWMAASLSRKDERIPKHWGGMEMFLDQQVTAADADLQRVYANFRGNLAAILSVAGRAKVPVLLSTVAVNLEDSPPFLSENAPTDTVAIEALLAEARWSEAEAACRNALEAAQDRPAILHYWLGRSLLEQGRLEPARASFQRACDLDTLRFRADTRINAIVRDVAAGAGAAVTLVDAERAMALADSNGIPGKEFFHEHVHLTYEGNYELGRVLAEAAGTRLGLSADEAAWMSEAACAASLGLTLFHKRELLQDVRGRLRASPFAQQYGYNARDEALQAVIAGLNAEMTPALGERAMTEYAANIRARPDDWVLRQQCAFLLGSADRHAEAEQQWEAVVEAIPHDPVSWFHLGSTRNRLQQWKEAESALREAIRWRERHPNAWNSLGISLSRQERFAESYVCFNRAFDYDPQNAEALMNWGLVLQNQGDPGGARTRFEQAIQADPKHLPSHVQLAHALTKASDFDRAAKIYGRIVQLLPRDPGARINLALVYLKLERRAEAVSELQAALALDPGNSLASGYLRQLKKAE